MSKNITLKFDGKPLAVQSFRFTRSGLKFQPKHVVYWKNYIAITARQQLGFDFVPITDKPIGIDVTFAYLPPLSWSKKKKAELEAGTVFYKTTKPDLTDNLMKGFIDALAGIVWDRDQLIATVASRKIYALKAGITLKAWEL